MIGRKVYDDPMFLVSIENEIFESNLLFSKTEILEKYILYIQKQINSGIKKYLLLRHLFGLYYKTSLSKKWKKFLNMVIRNEVNILRVPFFEEIIYDKES